MYTKLESVFFQLRIENVLSLINRLVANKINRFNVKWNINKKQHLIKFIPISHIQTITRLERCSHNSQIKTILSLYTMQRHCKQIFHWVVCWLTFIIIIAKTTIKHLTDYGFFHYPNYDNEYTKGQQTMLTPPWHLTLSLMSVYNRQSLRVIFTRVYICIQSKYPNQSHKYFYFLCKISLILDVKENKHKLFFFQLSVLIDCWKQYKPFPDCPELKCMWRWPPIGTS